MLGAAHKPPAGRGRAEGPGGIAVGRPTIGPTGRRSIRLKARPACGSNGAACRKAAEPSGLGVEGSFNARDSARGVDPACAPAGPEPIVAGSQGSKAPIARPGGGLAVPAGAG